MPEKNLPSKDTFLSRRSERIRLLRRHIRSILEMNYKLDMNTTGKLLDANHEYLQQISSDGRRAACWKGLNHTAKTMLKPFLSHPEACLFNTRTDKIRTELYR